MNTASRIAILLGLLWGAGPAAGDDEKTETPPAPATGAVSGKVTLADGKPLPAGWVTFHGKKPEHTVRVNIDNGKYAAKAVPVGPGVRVTVDVEGIRVLARAQRQRLQLLQERAELLKKAKAEDAGLAEQIKDVKGRLKVTDEMERKLKGIKASDVRPRKPLSLTVKAGQQTFDIRLAVGKDDRKGGDKDKRVDEKEK